MAIDLSAFSVVDLFCGAGGLTHGFVKAGFSNIAGVDFDQTCRFAYERNNKASFLHADIASVSQKQIADLFTSGKRRILIGCAPCQPYSTFNQKGISNQQKKDPRWELLYAFSRIITQIKPEVVSMENVPFLAKFQGGTILKDFIQELEGNGYFVNYEILDAQRFGVPQRRNRLVLLASRHSRIPMPKPTRLENDPVTVRNAIGEMPRIVDGEICVNDSHHRTRKLSPLVKARIKSTPEGGSWKDWPEELKLECHKRPGGKKYASVYGRMAWNQAAPTITTYCLGVNNGRFTHPEQHRGISLREAAILQSFPKKYQFFDSKLPPTNMANVAKHIGNSVPPLLGRAIANAIKLHLKEI